jgi:hypothetical protein
MSPANWQHLIGGRAIVTFRRFRNFVLIPLGVLLLLAIVAWRLAIHFLPSGTGPLTYYDYGPLDLQVDPVALSEDDRALSTIGRLDFICGVKVTSAHEAFGGFSGLIVADDGTSFLAMSDRGLLWTGDMAVDEPCPLRISNNAIKISKAEDKGFLMGLRGDVEALTQDADGNIYISIEHKHRVLMFSVPPENDFTNLFGMKPSLLADMPDADLLPPNGGVEALASLASGKLLLITEDALNGDGTLKAWIFENGVFEPLSYRPTEPFSPTDATQLPSGDLLVLERFYSPLTGVAIRVCLVDGALVRPGGLLTCQGIAEFRPPLTIDNMEGLAIRQNDSGETILYMVSDDNFNNFQDTLLLMFRLLPEPEERP